jgi:hypothetical protein
MPSRFRERWREGSSLNRTDEYFPEPSVRDDTWGVFGEQPVDWLMRSTLPRAASIRQAMNDNLGHFPERHSRSLARKLRTAWQSHYFELIVGRYLQEMGAAVEPEPLSSNGTRIDYRADFPDGVVSVEAISKVYNRAAAEELKRNQAVVSVVEPLVPAGWGLVVHDVPSLEEANTDGVTSSLAAWFASLPRDAALNERLGFIRRFPSGDLAFDAVAVKKGVGRILVGAGVTFMGNSQERIRAAVRDPRKRAQARGAVSPALLAIDGGTLASDLEDFDVALLGGGVQHMGIDRAVAGFSFDASGELSTDVTSPWAGVLAFLDVGVFRAREPVLYVSPHFRGHLPDAFLRLERRELAIRVHPRQDEGRIKSIAFGRPDDQASAEPG